MPTLSGSVIVVASTAAVARSSVGAAVGLVAAVRLAGAVAHADTTSPIHQPLAASAIASSSVSP
jgi:hypothetical protein